MLAIKQIPKEFKGKTLKFKNFTAAQFNKLKREKAIIELSKVIHENLKTVSKILDLCVTNKIKHYSFESKIFPLITVACSSVEFDVFPNYSRMLQTMYEIGRKVTQNKMSISILVDKKDAASAARLTFLGNIMNLINVPNDNSCPLIINFDNIPGNPQIFTDNFMKIFMSCGPGVKSRVVIQNSGQGYWNCGRLQEWFSRHCGGKYGMRFPLSYNHSGDLKNPTLDNLGKLVSLKENYFKFYKTWSVAPVFVWGEKSDFPFLGFDCVWLNK